MDVFTKDKRSRIMSSVKNKDSKIELLFRKGLWRRGLRYRKNVNKYFGKPDIVLPKFKAVIFIDSCFWHGCKKHGSMPQTHKIFWKRKIKRNIQRDEDVNGHYKKLGWRKFRIWEHDLKNNSKKIIENFVKQLKKNRTATKTLKI